MNEEKFEPTLEDILHGILLRAETAENSFSPAELRRWTTRFPQYEREITEFFITEAELETLSERETAPEFAEKFAARSQAVLDGILGKEQNRAVPIESLLKAAAAQNLRFPDLVRKTGMSGQLLTALEQRSVVAASISKKAFNKLAEVLKTSVDSLTAYFEQPPQFIAGASYKSADQPEIGEQKDFAELVRDDLQLSEAQKQDLLD